MFKKLSILAILLLCVLWAGSQIIMPRLVEKRFETLAAANVGVDHSAALKDGLHIYICGAGSPLPDPKRSGPCIGVIAGQQAFIFDAGTGGAQNLGPMGFPLHRSQAIFLTHLHSDHIDGLGQMLLGAWINSARRAPIPVTGPQGTAQIVDGFNQAYRIDQSYRSAHHGDEIANPASFGAAAREITLAGQDAAEVYQSGDVKISAFTVNHEPVSPAFGYRVDYKGRSIAISGDTAYDPRIAQAAKGVDILFHEALNPDMVKTLEKAAMTNGAAKLAKIFADIQDYHSSPVEAAQIAKAAQAKALVLYHIVPMLPNDALIPLFLKGTESQFDGKITVSEDGMIMRLPAQSDDIHYENGLNR